MHWNTVLKEVLEKKKSSQSFKVHTNHCVQKKDTLPKRIHSHKYFLGDKYPDIYLTRREAECALSFIQGKTFVQTGLDLNLSARTIEYYTKNIKKKLNCVTKNEIVKKIIFSDFLKNVDFFV